VLWARLDLDRVARLDQPTWTGPATGRLSHGVHDVDRADAGGCHLLIIVAVGTGALIGLAPPGLRAR